jgi:hypothetical protein
MNHSDNLVSSLNCVVVNSKKNCLGLLVLLTLFYSIPFYLLFIINILFLLYLHIYYPQSIQYIRLRTIDYIYEVFTGYLGNCSFDPLPKTKH